MILPLWSAYAFAAAFSMTAIPLIQEKFKADSFSLVFWNKIIVAIIMLPFILSIGLPQDPAFYGYCLSAAVLYTISDVIYFRAVPIIGSGMVTRLLPSAVVISFFLWFAIDPDTITPYTTPAWKIPAIGGILALFLYSAMQVRKCAISWQGVRYLWPVIFAASTGGSLVKLTLQHASPAQGIIAFMFVQSLMMVALLGIYYQIKKPVPAAVMRSVNTLRTALIIGTVSTIPIFLKTTALRLADNPGIVLMILTTDFLWVMLVYRLIGRNEKGNLWAGIGIVTSAVLLIAVKNF